MATKSITSDLYQEEYLPSFIEKWDELIDWDGRAQGEGDFYPQLLHEAGCSRVLDVAAGTGYHAVQLARAGFSVVAADGAANMCAKTLENARSYGLELEVIEADWRTLSSDITERFDAVLCLGNAFTHLFSEDERVSSMEEFSKVLRPGGLLIIDQRNYDKILDEGFSTKHQYYYTGEGVDARPVELTTQYVKFQYTFPDGEVHHLTMCPIRQEYLTTIIEKVGFRNVRRFGDFKENYNFYEPDFVVQVAQA